MHQTFFLLFSIATRQLRLKAYNLVAGNSNLVKSFTLSSLRVANYIDPIANCWSIVTKWIYLIYLKPSQRLQFNAELGTILQNPIFPCWRCQYAVPRHLNVVSSIKINGPSSSIRTSFDLLTKWQQFERIGKLDKLEIHLY